MTDRPTVIIHFKELSTEPEDGEQLRESIDKRCHHLGEEFPEVARCEISLSGDGAGYVAQAHLTGKATDLATQAGASEMRPAVDQVLAKVERQLRRAHDKRIFSQRRDAQRDPPKRKQP